MKIGIVKSVIRAVASSMPMPKYSPGRNGINNSKINLKWLKYILVFILTITLLKMGLIHFVGMNLKNIVVTYRQIPQEYQVDTKWNVGNKLYVQSYFIRPL